MSAEMNPPAKSEPTPKIESNTIIHSPPHSPRRDEVPKKAKLKASIQGSRKEPPDPPPGPSKGGRKSMASRPKRSHQQSESLRSSPPPTLHQPSTPPRLAKPPRGSAKSNKVKVQFFSPRTSRNVKFSLGTNIVTSSESEASISDEGNNLVRSRKRGKPAWKQAATLARGRALNRIKHEESKGWANVGTSLTIDLHKTFESFHNDYSPHKYEMAESLVAMQHIGHPCDRPRDIRARPFILKWITADRGSPKKLRKNPRPVFRAEFRCLGNCNDGTDSTDEDENDGAGTTSTEQETDDSESDMDVDSASDSEAPAEDETTTKQSSRPRRRKKRRCDNHVRLHVEVLSDDLTTAVIYRQRTHNETRDKYLEMSPYIRQCIMEYSSFAGMTVGKIKNRLLRIFEDRATPNYRRPSSQQITNIVQNIRRRERVLDDPLLAIGVFAEKNPDKIFHYSPPNYDTDPPRNFATGIKHPFALQNLLLWGRKNGVGFDSSYRNKNENRAPVTFLTALDENHRMVPGTVYLSGDVTADTLEGFLVRSKALVEEMATGLLHGSVGIERGLEEYEGQLLGEANRVRNADSWEPAFFMIDKSTPEKAAIERVFPGILIRICQFHVIQAILRWDRDHGGPGAYQPRPSLTLKRKHQLLFAVRAVQRCRFIERWPLYIEEFRRRVARIVEGSRVDAETIMAYFENNWFSEEWRYHWTDMGLPGGANRDGMLSTNNWTERAFKTFDQIFLDNRANKSAYRLVLILANEWFQYYQEWHPSTKKYNRELTLVAQRGHRLWNSGEGVQAITLQDGRQAWKVADLSQV